MKINIFLITLISGCLGELKTEEGITSESKVQEEESSNKTLIIVLSVIGIIFVFSCILAVINIFRIKCYKRPKYQDVVKRPHDAINEGQYDLIDAENVTLI